MFSATLPKNPLFSFFQIPNITAYMMTGLMLGPYFFSFMNEHQVSELGYITRGSLSFIAFSAGAELYMPEIVPVMKPIVWVSFFMIMFTMVIGTAFTFVLGGTSLLPWLGGYTSCNFGAAMLVATIRAARSPTSILAVVRELQASGPITSVMISITVAGDVFVLTIFATVQAITINLCSSGAFDGVAFVVNLFMVPAAVLLGWLLGHGLVRLLHFKRLKHLILPIGFCTYLFCDFIHAVSMSSTRSKFALHMDASLICITAGEDT